MDGIEHLRGARKILCTETEDKRERLRLAAKKFWSAYFFVESWPHSLWMRADMLVERILQYGVIDHAVVVMSAATVDSVTRDLQSFCEDAERIWRTGQRPL